MREGGKKHLRKKNIEPIFGKVNESDQIKKTLDIFLEKLMRCFFYVPKLTVLFSEIGNNPMRALGKKKTPVFFW